jgi:hypothetical protein
VSGGGPSYDILKKIRKKEDTKISEFLLSYRNRKKKKQDTDYIMISIQMKREMGNSYHSFLQQFFKCFLDRIRRNWNEYLYKNLIKEARRSKVLLKKFLLELRMFYFTIVKNEGEEKGRKFIRQIGNFTINLRELAAGRCHSCRGNGKKNNLSLVPVVASRTSEKVELLIFSDENLDTEYRNFDRTIDFRTLNFLKKLSESGKRLHFGQISRLEKF